MAPTPLGTKIFAVLSMQLKLLTSSFHIARRKNGKKIHKTRVRAKKSKGKFPN